MGLYLVISKQSYDLAVKLIFSLMMKQKVQKALLKKAQCSSRELNVA